MLNFYFTYGTADYYPYIGGWTTVSAPNYRQACEVFRAVHPNIRKGILNCADIYSETEFKKLFDGENYGAGEHEHIYYAYVEKPIKDETHFFDNECLEEAIIHCRDVASDESTCIKCRDDHTQLAIWLEELKVRRKDNAG